MNENPIQRIPITVAARKGVSWVSDRASEGRVVLTKFGRPTAVIDSADRLDHDLSRLREAAEVVVSTAADHVASRTSFRTMEEACAHLGLLAGDVRQRAEELATAAE